MKKKRILAMILAVASCLSLAVSVSAATTPNRKTTDFRDFDKSAWYVEAVSAAVDNGLLYGKSSTIIDPNGDMTRAEMARDASIQIARTREIIFLVFFIVKISLFLIISF